MDYKEKIERLKEKMSNLNSLFKESVGEVIAEIKSEVEKDKIQKVIKYLKGIGGRESSFSGSGNYSTIYVNKKFKGKEFTLNYTIDWDVKSWDEEKKAFKNLVVKVDVGKLELPYGINNPEDLKPIIDYYNYIIEFHKKIANDIKRLLR